MANDYFEHVDNRIADGTLARASQINDLLDQVEVGFEQIPARSWFTNGARGYAAAGGAANALTVTLDPAPASYVEGLSIAFKAAANNTSAVTLNMNGLGPIEIVDLNLASLGAGALITGGIYTVRYSAGHFLMTSVDSRLAVSVAAALASATAAAASETAAASSETAAGLSEAAAAASETAAGLSEAAAAASETAAGLSEAAATARETAAGLSETAAASSEANAAASAASALSSKNAAAASEANAAASEAAAAISESNAAVSAASAATFDPITHMQYAAGQGYMLPNWDTTLTPPDAPTVIEMIEDGATGRRMKWDITYTSGDPTQIVWSYDNGSGYAVLTGGTQTITYDVSGYITGIASA